MEERVQNIYQCAVCLKEFSRKSTCKSHMKLHTGERPYECETCGMTFASKSNLTNHVLTHSHQKCTICGKTFTSKPLLKSHMIMHSSERPHECSMCHRCFKRKGELRSHMVTHTGEKRYKCQVCGNRFTERHSLKTHMRLHTGEKPFKCNVCGKMFSRKSSYNSHTRMHTGVQPYKCLVCGKKFAHRSVMVSHLRKHMIRECNMCGMNFMKENELTAHIREQHQEDWPHRCHICGHTFTNNAKVKKHMRLHTEVKNFRCNVCSRQFLHKSTLQTHMLSHAESEARPTCNICGKSYTAKLSLEIHMRTHTGEKPFMCSVCGKQFTRKSGCVSHMRLHTGEKPYSCNICGKRFAYASGIRSHMRLHNRAECSLCGVKLIGGIDPKKHITHSIVAVGAKCSLCDIEFKSLSLFKTHLFKHSVTEREEECRKNAEAIGIEPGQMEGQATEDEGDLSKQPEFPVLVEDDSIDKKMNLPEVAMLEAFPSQGDTLLNTEPSFIMRKDTLTAGLNSLSKVKQENAPLDDQEFFDTAVLEVTKEVDKLPSMHVSVKQEQQTADDIEGSSSELDEPPQDPLDFDRDAASHSPLRDIDSLQSSLSPSVLSNPPSPSPNTPEPLSSLSSHDVRESITVTDREDFHPAGVSASYKVITISTISHNSSPVVSVDSTTEKPTVLILSPQKVTVPRTVSVTPVKSGTAEVVNSSSVSVKEIKPSAHLPVVKTSVKGRKQKMSSPVPFPLKECASKLKVDLATKKSSNGEDLNLANTYSAYVKKVLNLIKPPEKQLSLIKALNSTMDEFIEKYQSWK